MEIIQLKNEIYKLRGQLDEKNRELDTIYNSLSYKYFLKPLFSCFWYSKFFFKANLRMSRLFFISCWFKKIVLLLSRINYKKKYSWRDVYIRHIKYGTCPPAPRRLTLMLNRSCNLHCRFCDVSDVPHQRKELSRDDAFRVVDAAGRLGVKDITLTGGEPFLYADIFDIISFINERNIRVAITTNGLLVKRYLDSIIKHNIDCMSISLDGKEKTHDFLRNQEGAYKQALEAIYLLKQNKINTSINFVITNRNVYEMEGVYEFFAELNIPIYFFPVINKPHLFFSQANEVSTYLHFIKKLRKRNVISVWQHEYLRMAVAGYFGKLDARMRCLGLCYELGVNTNAEVSPCCVWENRKTSLNNLGNLREANLEELWYSAKFRQSRLSIFNEGCQNCLNPSIIDLPRIIGMDFVSPSIGKKRNFSINPNNLKSGYGKPGSVHMRFTNKCNLSCRHCDIWKNDQDDKNNISSKNWKEIIDKLRRWLGDFTLHLAGGEILLYPDALSIVRYSAKKGVKVGLITNATLLNEPTIIEIINSGMRYITLSLDGLEDTHSYTRNNRLLFSKINKAVTSLVRYRKREKLDVNIATVITRYNLKQLPEIVRVTKGWGADGIVFQALDNNFGAEHQSDWFKGNDFWPVDFPAVEEAIDCLIAMKESGSQIMNSVEQLCGFKKYYKNPYDHSDAKCFTGIKNFIVNEKGEVLLCWGMPAVGKIVDGDPEKIWNNELARRLRQRIGECKRTCRILNCNNM